MGPGGVARFNLDSAGNLTLTGDLTANGIFYASDRNLKTDFGPVDPAEILHKVAQLPVSQWRFKREEENIRHTGPMAQDFYAAFGLGRDERHINPADISGVALAAIQGLQRALDQERELNRERIGALERELEGLKAIVRGLATDRR